MTLGTNRKKLLAIHVGCLHNDYDSLILFMIQDNQI